MSIMYLIYYFIRNVNFKLSSDFSEIYGPKQYVFELALRVYACVYSFWFIIRRKSEILSISPQITTLS